ncbi:MAG: FAD-dependent oxidoreductase [Flavobacteriales bacterium]
MANNLRPEERDVLIVGGGAAGCGAAMALQQAGVSYLVLEQRSDVGGAATQAMVGTICGAMLRSASETPQWVLRDRLRSFCERVMERSSTGPEHATDGLWYLPYRIDALQRIAREVLSGADDSLRTGAFVSACETHGNGIGVAQVRGEKGQWCIAPKAVVDCTGNGHVSTLCGADVIREPEYQAPTRIMFLDGVKAERTEGLEFVIQRAMIRAAGAGWEADEPIGHVGMVHGSHRQASLGVKVTLKHRVSGDEDFQALNAQGRRAALYVLKVLRHWTEVFKEATVREMAPATGVRTEQRPVGKHILTEGEVLNAAKPADGVAVGAWPIEHWGDGPGADMQWFPEGEHYLIPAGALTSVSIDGLYFAGRGISATEMAVASARVMGTCLGTGYAAGMLAAYRALGWSGTEAIEKLRKEQLPIPWHA